VDTYVGESIVTLKFSELKGFPESEEIRTELARRINQKLKDTPGLSSTNLVSEGPST